MPRKNRPISKKTRDEALAALDGMRDVVKNEMLTHGTYVSSEIENHVLAAAGAVCGGHKACAVGSLWLGGGVRMKSLFGGAVLPGVEEEERRSFLRNRDGLRVAYHALNDAAERFMARHPEVKKRGTSYRVFEAPVESLFEEHQVQQANGRYRDVGRQELLPIITAAKRIVNARELKA